MLHVSDVVNKMGRPRPRPRPNIPDKTEEPEQWCRMCPPCRRPRWPPSLGRPQPAPCLPPGSKFFRYLNIIQIFQYFSDISICFSYMFIKNKKKKFLILPHWPFSSPCEWGRSQCWVCNCFVISTAAYLAIWFLFWKYLIISVTGWTGGKNKQNNCLPIWIMCN